MNPRACTLVLVSQLCSCSLLAPSDAELRAGSVSSDSGVSSDGSTGTRDAEADRDLGDAELGDASDAQSDGGRPPSPIPTTQLALWLMADKDVVHNSTAVTEWRDQSGNGLHARQSVKDLYPHLWATGIAGKPALEFDGTSDWLALPEGFADFTAGVSMFAIAQTRTLEQCGSIVELSNGPEWDDIAVGRTSSFVGYEVSDTYMDQGLAAIPVNTPILLSATHPPSGDARTFLNGQYSAQKAIALPVNKRRASNFVGQSLYEACRPWSGLIGEIIIYNRYLDELERKRVEAYLQAKWGCCGG